MIRLYAHPEGHQPNIRVRRLLVEVPICVAVALSALLLALRVTFVLRDDLYSNPDGWRGVLPLAVILVTASFFVVLVCAGIAALTGFVLRRLFVDRHAARYLGMGR